MTHKKQIVKYFDDYTEVRLIETDNETFFIDVFEQHGRMPADLSGAICRFHLMEYVSETHIWTKQFEPVNDPDAGWPNVVYPFTVPVVLDAADTRGLKGHYIGQLELIDYQGKSRISLQMDIVINKKATNA